jgi:hypothetical protein
MILHEHAAVRCPVCGNPLYYGVKRESAAWKVFYQCQPTSGCDYETMAGRVPLGDVDSLDRVYGRAEEMGRRL